MPGSILARTRSQCEGKHKCDTCGYSTDRKSSMDAHINRKRACVPPRFIRMIRGADGTEEPEVGETQCEHCNKVLSCKKSLNRHFATCKAKKHDEWALQNQKDEVWRKKDTKPPMVEGKHRCTMCHHDFNSRQALHMHRKRICPAIKNVVVRLDSEIDAQTPESQMTPFKKFNRETSSHITDAMWVRWCRRFTKYCRGAGALNLMDMIWFNASEPQNHTVRFTNKKLKYCEIWNGEKWATEDKNWVADQMLERVANDFDCFLANNKTRLLTMSGDLKYQSWHVEAIKEMIDIILCNTNPKEKRKIRTRFLAKMYDFTKKINLWASKNPFNRDVIQKHQSAMVHAKRIEASAVRLDLNREFQRIHHETKELIEEEVQRRLKGLLAKMGISEEQVDRLRGRTSDAASTSAVDTAVSTT